ncbi:MAG: hypothetical protein AAF067_04765 [Pseudomonadota bacterium]
MKKMLFLASAAAAFAAVPAITAEARDHENGASHEKLKTVLSHERRADDMARDKYRRPAETLAFFGIKPEHTVVEYGPGGGWYTRVLLPYIHGSGKYVAVGTNSDSINFTTRAREARSKSWPERFPDTAAGWTGIDAKEIAAYESDEVPDEMKGTVDRVVIFRSLHGMMNRNYADSELRALRELLADDGMIGIVQHRAKPDAAYEISSGSRGYLKQDSVVALFELHGFELADSSEINANPKDSSDYPKGVWTLPPRLAEGETDKSKYLDIGESDRMTLLFRKRS